MKVINLNNDHIKYHFHQLENRLNQRITAHSDAPIELTNIIEYLINFLGCIVLSALGKETLKKKCKNISGLTIGKWVEVIEDALRQQNNKILDEVKSHFCDNDGEIKPNIKNWIVLRNKFTHDINLPSKEIFERECKFINLKEEYNKFVESIIKIFESNSSILNSVFFKFEDGDLYIYSGLEDDNFIKFRHFSKPPLLIKKPSDFPLYIQEVSLSLEENEDDILWGYDKIKVKVETAFQKLYKNDFLVYINDTLAGQIQKEYKNGETIIFDTTNLSEIGIRFNDYNHLKVEAKRNGKAQDTTKKIIKIFDKPPELTIIWQDSNDKHIDALIGTEEKKVILIISMFDISIISINVSDGHKNIQIPDSNVEKEDNKSFSFSIPFNSVKPSIREISVLVQYEDITGQVRDEEGKLKIHFKPNFFMPAFTGDKRKSIISELVASFEGDERRRPLFVTGEGGTGKTRLIKEFLLQIGKQPDIEITVNPIGSLINELAKGIGISKNQNLRKRNRQRIQEEVFNYIEANKGLEKILWIKDCHEISEREIDFLRWICKEVTGGRMLMILESRDASWSENAKKIIEELGKEDIYNIPLERLEQNDLINVLDSIFYGNDFPEDFKSLIVSKSDGIIYILLQCLKNLYDQHYIAYSDSFPSWVLNKPVNEIKDILKEWDYKKVINISIEPVLEFFDKEGYGEKVRDLLRYLYFGPLTFYELTELLNISKEKLAYICEKIKSACIITEKEFKGYKFYMYHHQIKRDYCKKKYLPDEIECDYFILFSKFEPRSYQLRIPLYIDGETSVKDIDDILGKQDVSIKKYITDGSIWRLSEPYLMEKIDYLFEEICDDINDKSLNPLLIMKTYLHLFESEKKFFGYLSIFLNPSFFRDDPSMLFLRNEDIRRCIEDIESLIEKKKVDQYSQYYVVFMTMFEEWKLFQEIWIKTPDNLRDDYFDETESGSETYLHILLFMITNRIKNDIDLLKDYLARLEHIKAYNDLSRGIQLDYPPFYGDPKFLFSQICYFSLAHITGILTLVDKENSDEHKNKYKKYIEECYFQFDNKQEFKEYLNKHYISIRDSDLDYQYLLNEINPRIIEEIRNLK